jgi:hypothetical protein
MKCARREQRAGLFCPPAENADEKFEGAMRVERFDDRAIWQLMYFGKAQRQG